ncbi:hypothetical protein T265_01995 [Opisthorchis viverrini]|uniref:Apoptosis inhibitory protein 5 n=1 Tax=Opisthorchis viverrini TaxID=6198 RepID=A0A075A0X8_OPIVI|nr:hypothetical protein T265_01995 [Opisthorchis viverrini]KER31912.1 hypothetical protein T265_01995 [Opisthorchis viverrini]
MTTPTVTELYAYYDTLNNEASSADEREAAYRAFLSGTKGGDIEKRLASQFIARFSKQFENLREESFNCILDLCDDEDVAIRKQAVHDLMQFCKRIPSFIPRVADVLVQMFQTEDASEMHVISLSLNQLLTLEPKATLAGVFNQMLTVNPENPREHVMKFLVDRLKTLPEDKLSSEVEEFVVEQVNKVLHDVSEEEFPLVVSILSSLKCMSTLPGRQKLVAMITEQALQACPEFSPTDPACVAQIRESVKQAALCISKNVHARELYMYLLQKVIPKIVHIPDTLEEDKFSLLRSTAELASLHESDLSALTASEQEQCLQYAFDSLVHYLPELPNASVDAQPSDPPVEGKTVPEKPVFPTGLKLSELECLLCICCQLGRVRPQYFGGYSSEQERESEKVQLGAARLRQIRPRLQYLSQVAQEYSQSIAGHLGQNGHTDENKAKLIAHRLVTNIPNLVRLFFHNPPVFQTNITFSWLKTDPVISPGSKRPAVMANLQSTESPTRSTMSRREQPRYAPPIGRWSRGNQPQNRASGDSTRNYRGRGRNW